ncbi:hypothetical protein LCM4577_23020 [Mesorhizobium sp. LCM 4577]|nr:hypothetical protein LCM4577_23020 [Mesorhizobium sp. LCM 4577]
MGGGVSSSSDKHSVAHVAAGYLYQARLALSEALKYANVDSSVEVSIEKLDDVSFEKDGAAIDLLQTKHHLHQAANLTDGSVDLWKTLGIWAEKTKDNPSLPGRTRFALVTTSAVSEGTAAHLLRPATIGEGPRDIDKAHELLLAAAAASKNAAIAKSIVSFTALPTALQKELLSAVQILDGAPLIADLEAVIENQIALLAPRGKAALAREQLEGWWWPRVCALLQSISPGTIAVTSLEQKLDEIRESMKRDALPLIMDDAEVNDAELSKLDDFCFVRQLRGIGLGQRRLELAKQDYYRAFAQRSHWVRESLVLDDEVSHFERNLIEEWQPRFEQMRDGLTAGCGEPELKQAGLGLYSWVENEARFPFRTLTNRFLSVGSYHILADRLRVGWHRDYVTLFAKQLEDA